jgi:hypothetical protein
MLLFFQMGRKLEGIFHGRLKKPYRGMSGNRGFSVLHFPVLPHGSRERALELGSL